MNKMHFENRTVSREFFWFIWLLYALVYMTKTCFTAAMASIVANGIMAKSEVGFITAVFYIVYAPLQFVGGVFADKHDPEKLITIGLLGGALANLIIFFNQNYYVVLITWVFNAVIQFGIWPSVFKIISSQIVRSDQKNATYFISFSSTAGLIISYGVAAFMPKWYYNFAFSAIVLVALAVALNVITKVTGPYWKPDKEPLQAVKDGEVENGELSSFRLFWESGFFLIALIGFLIQSVGNSVKTLSATWLMESYDHVSAGLGNILNILIIAVSVIGIIFAKTFLYPKMIKSAPRAIFAVLLVVLAFTAVLIFHNIAIVTAVMSMCIISASASVISLLMSYCNLRFAKFGKSATAAGLLNMMTSIGYVMSSYGITKIADVFNWRVVSWTYFIMIFAAVVLILLVLPLWKNFKKKYFASHQQPLVTKS